jgi:serine/threonine protein phosphatase PrpC
MGNKNSGQPGSTAQSDRNSMRAKNKNDMLTKAVPANSEVDASQGAKNHPSVMESAPDHIHTSTSTQDQTKQLIDSNGKPAKSRGIAKGFQRAKSALPPATETEPVEKVPRSKSLPNMGYRRADINIPEEAMEEVVHLQKSFSQEASQNGSSISLSEKDLDEFYQKCGTYMFGSQKVSGVPGQERARTGITPFHVSVSCIKGLKGPSDTSPNQDNYSYCELDGFEFFSVQDGHGPGGHYISFRGVRSLPFFVCRSKFFPENMDEAVIEGYRRCHADLLAHSCEHGFDIQISGAACVMVIKSKEHIWLTHAGDSRIVVGDPESGEILVETEDHKPNDPRERARLEAAGCEVQTFRFDHNVQIHRVFVRGTEYPGLCMSRSLGDQSVKQHGVLSLPAIRRITSSPGKMFIVLASDGVWEFIPSKLVCSSLSKKLIQEGKDKCVARIVTEAKKRWKSNEGSYCDDITAMLIIV